MKCTVATALILIPLFSFNQIIAFKTSEVKPHNDIMNYKQWYKVSDNLYAIYFKKTTIGAKEAVEKVESILESNNISFDSGLDNSYLASWVKNIHDYENLALSCRTGASKVSKLWKSKNNNALGLSMAEDGFTIFWYKDLTKEQ